MTFQVIRTSIHPPPLKLVHTSISCRIKIRQSTEMGVVFVNVVRLGGGGGGRGGDSLLYLGYLIPYQ